MTESDEFAKTSRYVAEARRDHPDEIYPPEGQIFRALEMTPPGEVRVVIVGEDPYPSPGVGLCSIPCPWYL